MKSKFLAFFLLVLPITYGYGQEYNMTEAAEPQGKTIIFRFVAENDTFYVPYQGNGDKLSELVATIDYYKSSITNGQATINVAGYCSSYATSKENIASAVIRANRVKSELIVRNGIKEANFLTTVHATSFEGRKSVVVVTLRVPQISEPVKQQPVAEQPKQEVKSTPEVKPEPQPAVEQPIVESKPKPVAEQPRQEVAPKPVKVADNYQIALRTNLLYGALLMPTIGAEWRINSDWGVKVDANFSNWGGGTGRVQKLWLVNPEVRRYIGEARRLYVGLGSNFGRYNIYKGMLGNLISNDTGYQGSLWDIGATIGYQLPLGKVLSLDFNLGLGYNSFSYDSFEVINDVRVYKDKNESKNTFGLTQAGVSLVWKLVK